MVKKTKKFNYGKNLKKAWKKEKAKRRPLISDDTLKSAWIEHKSIEGNYAEMGLTTDPNKSLRIPKTKTLLKPEIMDIEQAIELENQTLKKKIPSKPHVVETLEEEASRPVEKSFNLNESDQLLCIYMIEKYGEDYLKMSKDYKNYFQETPKQIKKRVNQFKNMKIAYQKYLDDKKEGVNYLDRLETKL